MGCNPHGVFFVVVLRAMEYLPAGKDQNGKCYADQSSQEDDGGVEVNPVFSKRPKQNHTDKKCKDSGAGRPKDLIRFFTSNYCDGMFCVAAHNTLLQDTLGIRDSFSFSYKVYILSPMGYSEIQPSSKQAIMLIA